MQLEMFDPAINREQLSQRPEPKLAMTHWAVIEEASPQFDKCVWGVGKTAEEALHDAAKQMIEWGGPPPLKADIRNVDDLRRIINKSAYRLFPATKGLAEDVLKYGGEIHFIVTRLGICIQEEYDGEVPT